MRFFSSCYLNYYIAVYNSVNSVLDKILIVMFQNLNNYLHCLNVDYVAIKMILVKNST